MDINYSDKIEKIYLAMQKGDKVELSDLISSCQNNTTFVSFIDQYSEEHSLNRKLFLQKAYVSIKYGYKILNGTKIVKNRDVVIRILMSMGMNISEVQKGLNLYGMKTLQEDDKRDQLIMASLLSKNRFRLEELNDWLIDMELEPIISD